MIRCGELCLSCHGQCRDIVTEEDYALIDCPHCNGEQCEKCGGEGTFRLSQCPRSYVDASMTDVVNIAALASKGSYPVAGGTLDQSAWFIQAMQTLESDINQLDNERSKRHQWQQT